MLGHRLPQVLYVWLQHVIDMSYVFRIMDFKHVLMMGFVIYCLWLSSYGKEWIDTVRERKW